MNNLDGIFVYDIDDLQQVASAQHGRAQPRGHVDADGR